MTLTITHAFVSGVPDDPAAIAAGEVVPSEWDAAHTVTGTVGPSIGARTILTANTNYYITTTGSDANDGSLASPWATLQHAVDFTHENIDGAGFQVFVNIGHGSFAGCNIAGTFSNVEIFAILGDAASLTAVTLTPTTTVGSCINLDGVGQAALIVCINMVLDVNAASGGYACVTTAGVQNCDFQQIYLSGVSFTGTSGTADAVFDLFGDYGDVWIGINPIGLSVGCSITNNFAHPFFSSGSYNQFTLINNLPINGAPTWSSSFIFLTAQSNFVANPGITITGAATGKRFSINGGSSAISNSGPYVLGPNYFPGNAPGTVDSASSYDGVGGPLPGIDTQTVNYTLAATDALGIVEMNLAGANTVTVPLNASVAFNIGTKIWITQIGAGATTIAGAGGVTVDNAGAVGGQWKSVKLYKRGTDEWVQTNA